MKREQPQSGGPAPDSNQDLVHTPRPAPGKVTPASRLPGGEGAAVQRSAMELRPASGSDSRPSSRLADDPAMDAAHRGLAAVAESGPATGAVVQRAEGEPARRAGDAIPAELRTRLMERLRASAEMQSVFAEIRTGRGNLDFAVKWSSRGNYHSAGEIYLDLNGNEEAWLSSMAHELVHLSTFVCGRAADVATNTREEFVRLKMEDEINAQATQYVTLLQLANTTARPAGYQDFRAHLASDHAAVLTNESWSEIERLAKVWLEDKYRNEWTTSNTGENYYTYWGNHWDRQHPR